MSNLNNKLFFEVNIYPSLAYSKQGYLTVRGTST